MSQSDPSFLPSKQNAQLAMCCSSELMLGGRQFMQQANTHLQMIETHIMFPEVNVVLKEDAC